MATDAGFSRNASQPHIAPKQAGSGSSIMRSISSGFNRLEAKTAAGRRKKSVAQKLGPGQDIFHNFHWDPPAQNASPGPKTAGRKPYDWTPRRSRELIKLIIHTDLKFDDIATAMKDDDGNGPSETTCRNHWHDIFGYSPDIARLKSREGCERRLKEHLQAFEAYQKHNESLRAPSVAEQFSADGNRNSQSSNTSTNDNSRRSSKYADSAYQGGDSNSSEQQGDSPIGQGLTPNTNFNMTTPESFANTTLQNTPSYNNNNTTSFANWGLGTLKEEGGPDEEVGPDEIAPDAPQPNFKDFTPLSDAQKGAIQIEEKEGLPQGFISFIKKMSIGSSTASRRPSSASFASHRRISNRLSRSSRPSMAASFMSFNSFRHAHEDAICDYLENCKATEEVPAGDIEELIRLGANVNARNPRGETPLHLAVALGAVVVCTLLLTNGADPEAKTKKGESIWKFGGKASKAHLDPDGVYEKKEQLLHTMVAAHIEFLRATAKYNPKLVLEEPAQMKKRRTSDNTAPSPEAWSRSGVARKKSKAPSTGSVGSVSRGNSVQAASPEAQQPDPFNARRRSTIVTGHVPEDVTPSFANGHWQYMPHLAVAAPTPAVPLFGQACVSMETDTRPTMPRGISAPTVTSQTHGMDGMFGLTASAESQPTEAPLPVDTTGMSDLAVWGMHSAPALDSTATMSDYQQNPFGADVNSLFPAEPTIGELLNHDATPPAQNYSVMNHEQGMLDYANAHLLHAATPSVAGSVHNSTSPSAFHASPTPSHHPSYSSPVPQPFDPLTDGLDMSNPADKQILPPHPHTPHHEAASSAYAPLPTRADQQSLYRTTSNTHASQSSYTPATQGDQQNLYRTTSNHAPQFDVTQAAYEPVPNHTAQHVSINGAHHWEHEEDDEPAWAKSFVGS